MFVYHQTAISLQRADSVNPTTSRYLSLDESNQMKSTYSTIHPDENLPSHNGYRLKSDFFFFLNHWFHILHFPNSTGLSTKPTGRHYTKYRCSPDIALNGPAWEGRDVGGFLTRPGQEEEEEYVLCSSSQINANSWECKLINIMWWSWTTPPQSSSMDFAHNLKNRWMQLLYPTGCKGCDAGFKRDGEGSSWSVKLRRPLRWWVATS